MNIDQEGLVDDKVDCLAAHRCLVGRNRDKHDDEARNRSNDGANTVLPQREERDRRHRRGLTE